MKIYDIVLVVSFSTVVSAFTLNGTFLNTDADGNPILDKEPRFIRFFGCPSSVRQIELGEGSVFSWVLGGRSGPRNCGFEFLNPLGLNLVVSCKSFRLTRDQQLTIDGGYGAQSFAGGNGPEALEFTENVSIILNRRRKSRKTRLSCEIVCLSEGAAVAIPPTTTTPTTPTTTTTTTPTTPTTTTTTTPTTPTTTTPTTSTTATTTTTTTTPATEATCTCGTINRSTRIVGGQEAEANEYPYMAALVGYGSSDPFCGGSLINDRYILTAAHCVDGVSSGQLQVILGEHDTSDRSDGTRVNVEQIIVHEGYDGNSLDNDIALLKITPPVDLGEDESINPICLPSAGQTFFGERVTTTGWGRLYSGGPQPDELYEVELDLITDNACASIYGSNNLSDNMICAEDDGKDSCQGDSGGPLAYIEQERATLVGVVSWGIGCARYPGVYTEVANYIDWINANTRDAETCDA